MQNKSKLLAGAAALSLLVAGLGAWARLDPAPAVDVRPQREASAPGAPGVALEPAQAPPLEPEPASARVALEAAIQLEVEEPEAGRAGIVLLRWPDRAPIARTEARVFGTPGLPIDDYESSASGRVTLPQELASEQLDLHVHVEGFEPLRARIGPFQREQRMPRVLLKPLTGWYGRVRSARNAPLAGLEVSGWWIEAPRPSVSGASAGGRPSEEVDFVVARGLVAATTPTDSDGYYYVPPLEGTVLGQLTLLATGADPGSSDVLRLPLPHFEPRLPDLVVHEPQVVRGRVVDPDGAPIAGAVVLPQLALGWSIDLEPLRTDEEGTFVLTAPAESVAVAVEKVGYGLRKPDLVKPASLDGLWAALAAITPAQMQTRELFERAYGEWSSHIPRARGFVPLDPWQSDVLVVMDPLEPIGVHVYDSELLTGIDAARVQVTYGGLDAQSRALFTDAYGDLSFPAADLQWQPVVVEVSANGYAPRVVPLELGRAHLRIGLAPKTGPRDVPALDRPTAPRVRGLVLGPGGAGRKASVLVYLTDREGAGTASPVWSGRSGADGTFSYSPGAVLQSRLLYFFAFTGEGPARLAARAGPISELAFASATTAMLPLEPALAIGLSVRQLEEQRDYRVRISYAPFPGARVALWDVIELDGSEGWRSSHLLNAPRGWRVRAVAERRMAGNVPIVDFLRQAPRQTAFKSLRSEWTDWEPASDPVIVRTAAPTSLIVLQVAARVDASGLVSGRPVEAPPLYVAARGHHGTWISPVDGNGWFHFVGVPGGAYQLLLYTPSDPGAGFSLDSRGELLGSLAVDCRYSRHGLVLPWRQAEPEPIEQSAGAKAAQGEEGE